jgi:hypothetical protein
MARAILILMLGMFFTALFIAAISVYILHDVDRDQIGQWNTAFADSCAEFVLFTLIIGVGVALFVFVGRAFFHLQEYSPRPNLVLLLGVGVAAIQYPWDLIGRLVFPKLSDLSLSLYLVLAIIVCSIVVIRDCVKQMRLRPARR